MPIYDFRCDKCSEITSVILSMDDCDNAPECAACGESTHKYIGVGIKSNIIGTRKGNFNSGDYS